MTGDDCLAFDEESPATTGWTLSSDRSAGDRERPLTNSFRLIQLTKRNLQTALLTIDEVPSSAAHDISAEGLGGRVVIVKPKKPVPHIENRLGYASSGFAEVVLPRARNRAIESALARARFELKDAWANQFILDVQAITELNSEEVEPIPLAESSLDQLIHFFADHAGLQKPRIVPTFEGNFRAEWQSGRQHFLGLEFLPDGRIKFVWFRPNPTTPHLTSRESGIVDPSEIAHMINDWRSRDWIVVRAGNG